MTEGKLSRGAAALLVLGLAGCQVLTRPTAPVDEFDLGPPPAAPTVNAVLPLREVSVAAPSWLATQALQYRLVNDQPTQRRSYADSRWVAPPAELLEAALRRAMVSGDTTASGAGCRLRVDLDELIQTFHSPARSHAIIEIRASLLAPRSDRLLARKRFSVSELATTADARGGVAATAAATQALSAALRDWLRQLDSSLAQRCAGT